jgi:hypothetical protein
VYRFGRVGFQWNERRENHDHEVRQPTVSPQNAIEFGRETSIFPESENLHEIDMCGVRLNAHPL